MESVIYTEQVFGMLGSLMMLIAVRLVHGMNKSLPDFLFQFFGSMAVGSIAGQGMYKFYDNPAIGFLEDFEFWYQILIVLSMLSFVMAVIGVIVKITSKIFS